MGIKVIDSGRRQTSIAKKKRSTTATKKIISLACGCKQSLFFYAIKQRRRASRRASSTKAKKIDSGEPQGSMSWPPDTRNPDQRDKVHEVVLNEEHDKYKAYQSSEHWTSRSPGRDGTCNVCGVRYHSEFFCPYNYVDGPFGLNTCRENCLPEQHPIGSESHRDTLRRFVRVSNVPRSLTESELGTLFEKFGPLLMCDLTRVRSQDSSCFGYVTFKSREHAEDAIDKLNGCHIEGRKLRVDWAYPRA